MESTVLTTFIGQAHIKLVKKAGGHYKNVKGTIWSLANNHKEKIGKTNQKAMYELELQSWAEECEVTRVCLPSARQIS